MAYLTNKLIFETLVIFFISFILYKTTIPIFSKLILDKPNIRSSHEKPTPTGGGIIFIILINIIAFYKGLYITLICTPLAFLSLIDDLKNIKSFYRYAIHFFTVTALIIFSLFDGGIISSLDKNQFLIILFPLIIFFSGIINFTNFMDGIDGLVVGCMTIIFISFSINNNLYLFHIVPCLLGFLIFNWNPAKIFMGDTGSTFIGALYVVILLYSNSFNEFLITLILSSPLFLDSFFCIIKRLIYKQNIFTAHKLHLYQRLVQAGYSHSQVSMLYISATLFLSFLAMLKNLNYLIISSLILILLGIILDKYHAISFRKSLTLHSSE